MSLRELANLCIYTIEKPVNMRKVKNNVYIYIGCLYGRYLAFKIRCITNSTNYYMYQPSSRKLYFFSLTLTINVDLLRTL